MRRSMPDILVAGGGIGGLVAALSLKAAGLTPRVFESVAEYKPLGVGINILPHAVRELTERASPINSPRRASRRASRAMSARRPAPA